MMEQGSPTGTARLKAPSWKDPRLLIGILLVLLSVSGVVAVIGSADKTNKLYAAKEPIAVGQSISADDLEAVDVRLGDVEAFYLTVSAGLAEGDVALQRIEKHQLVPRQSLGRADALDRKPVAIPVETALPDQVVPGARVDVWVSKPDSARGFDRPVLLLPGAEVTAVAPGSSALGASKSTVLLVLVTDQQMPELLGAQANGAKVSAVWNPSGVRQ
ncbi:flagellar protein FlgA [Arthrobacter sp. NicSoilE8]|nr:flagellar protein FlgA [Arthrobacter sp. NicSoilE8]